VVDAMRVRDEFMDMLTPSPMPTPSPTPSDDLASLVTEQIEFCNVILLNKVDEVNAEDLEHIRAIIRAIQPKAEIIECNYCDVPLERLLNTKSFNFEAVATSATWIHEVESPHHDHDDDDDDDEEHEHHHHDHEHGHSHMEEFGISTFVYYARRPFDLGLFDEFVAAHWPKSVIRCKGMCYFEEEYDMCYLFEQSGRQFNLRQAGQWYATMPEDELEAMKQSDATLRADWDPQYGDRMQKLVFIGQNMDRKAITDALDYCLV
jgi:G3E family GTPase